VAARYDAGEVVGSLGVLGPMRMDYPKTLGTVQAVASSVGRALNQLTGAS
jgi:transcriptional regulator of heat shock response